MYIDDFINAFNFLLDKGKHLNIYNIGDPKEIKIKDLAKKIARILNKKITLRRSAIPEGSAKKRCPDIKKIKKLGFKSKIKLEQGLARTINWYY